MYITYMYTLDIRKYEYKKVCNNTSFSAMDEQTLVAPTPTIFGSFNETTSLWVLSFLGVLKSQEN